MTSAPGDQPYVLADIYDAEIENLTSVRVSGTIMISD